MAKAKKKRAEKNDPKPTIKGSLKDVIRFSVQPPPKAITPPEPPKKKPAKKK
jgi:hypothetical protein